MKWVLDLITRVANEGHMDALALVDTFGVLSPHAMQYLVREVKKRINKRLEAHFHMDFGMGIANTIMALAEGVEVVHSTVLGLGERAGNVPMEETAMALLTLYGIDTGIKYDKLYGLAKLVEQLSRPRGRVATARWSATRSSRSNRGIIASWWHELRRRQATELFPFHWDVVGQPAPKVVVGKGSGIDSIKARAEGQEHHGFRRRSHEGGDGREGEVYGEERSVDRCRIRRRGESHAAASSRRVVSVSSN